MSGLEKCYVCRDVETIDEAMCNLCFEAFNSKERNYTTTNFQKIREFGKKFLYWFFVTMAIGFLWIGDSVNFLICYLLISSYGSKRKKMKKKKEIKHDVDC